MEPVTFFKHCPRCGYDTGQQPQGRVFDCQQCGFRLYFNVACAVVALLEDDQGKVLFIRRAKEPAKGKLALPGGFIDPEETAEEALRREIREEVGLEVTDLIYLCSRTNSYHYREVTYPVLDLAFVGRVRGQDGATLTLQAGEVAGGEWLDPSTVSPEEIAFPSAREAVRLHLLARDAEVL